MRKPKPNRRSSIRPEDLRHFPLPKNLFWMDLGIGQVLHSKYSFSGNIMACAMAVLLDREFLPSDGTDLGVSGFHSDNGGRWYCLEFSLRMPRRTCLRMVKQAVAAMDGQSAE